MIPSLTGLLGLQDFNVSKNQLTGTIPPLTGLLGLHEFYVANNQLTGVVPAFPYPGVLSQASLCPNLLTPSIDKDWDLVTGVTPWYTACITPTLSRVTPNTVTSGGGDRVVILSGSNFVQSSVVQIGSTSVATTFVSSTTLNAVIPAGNLAAPTVLDLSVVNQPPNGPRSNSLTFSVIAAPQPPTTTSPQPIPEVENGRVQSGYVIVTPDSGTGIPTAFVSYGLVQNGSVQSKAGILPTSLTTSASAVVEIVSLIGRNLGIAIANPNGGPSTVTLALKNENGALVGLPSTLVIAPYKQLPVFITELFSADVIGPSFIGSVNLQSGTPFAPLGLTFTGTSFSAIALGSTPINSPMPTRSLSAGSVVDTPRAGVVGGAGSVIFPQFAFGGGWATQVSLVNTGTIAATGRIDFFDTDVSPTPIKLNGSQKSTFSYAIPAGGTLIFAPRDQNGQSPL
jgi:hypothetical protein